SSRAPWPMLRASEPIPWATASQRAATPRNSAAKSVATGPRPLRTARGAGRFCALLPRAAGLRAVREVDRLVVPALRARLLGARPPFEEDVLLLRDPGGEDVRVAMGPTYFRITPVTGITRVRVAVSARPGVGTCGLIRTHLRTREAP